MAIRTDTIKGIALCAGGGGLELGVQLELGDRYQCVCYVEREAYAAATLAAHMEDGSLAPAPLWDDLSTFDGKPWRGKVDIISAGFPCQPFSYAGRRKGQDDSRNLWPHVRRIIDEVGPDTVFLENVPGVLPYYWHVILPDLQAMAYEVTQDIYTANEVGASQLRARLYIVARRGRPSRSAQPWGQHQDVGRVQEPRQAGDSDPVGTVADTVSTPAHGTGQRQDDGEELQAAGRDSFPLWPPGPADLDGWSRVLEQVPSPEPALCRVAHGMALRVEQLSLLGNGVVPLAAAYALRSLTAGHVTEQLELQIPGG